MPAPRLPWFRFWGGATGHAKVRELSDGEFRTWVEMLDLCAQQKWRGRFPSLRVAILLLRRPPAHVVELIRVGLVDEDPRDKHLTMHGWDQWQAEESLMRRAWDLLRERLAPVVYARDGRRCLLCGAEAPLSVDHIVPIKLGGSNDLDNLRTLCVPCNSRKGARIG